MISRIQGRDDEEKKLYKIHSPLEEDKKEFSRRWRKLLRRSGVATRPRDVDASHGSCLKLELFHQFTDGDALLQIQVAVRLLLEEAQNSLHGLACFFWACRW